MKRLAKISLVTGCVLVIGFFVYGSMVAPVIWKHIHRMQGVAALQAATSEAERTSAVGRLELTQTYPDGSWIAIFYADSHGGRIQSLAIVRDSDDHWFESNHHFCGSFSAARHRFRLYSDPETDPDLIPDPKALGDIYSILTATNLESAVIPSEPLDSRPSHARLHAPEAGDGSPQFKHSISQATPQFTTN